MEFQEARILSHDLMNLSFHPLSFLTFHTIYIPDSLRSKQQILFVFHFAISLPVLVIDRSRLLALRCISGIFQRLYDLLLVFVAKGLHSDRQLHCRIAVDTDKLVMF